MRKLLSAVALVALAVAPAMLAEDGTAIFKSKCAMCHGPTGDGQTTMGKKFGLKNLGSAEVQKLSDAELIKITSDGKDKMPAYKGKLTDAEIKAVVAHIRSLKK